MRQTPKTSCSRATCGRSRCWGRCETRRVSVPGSNAWHETRLWTEFGGAVRRHARWCCCRGRSGRRATPLPVTGIHRVDARRGFWECFLRAMRRCCDAFTSKRSRSNVSPAVSRPHPTTSGFAFIARALLCEGSSRDVKAVRIGTSLRAAARGNRRAPPEPDEEAGAAGSTPSVTRCAAATSAHGVARTPERHTIRDRVRTS